MAITAALVYQGRNRIRYLLTQGGGGGTLEIGCNGNATPDLITDTVQGALRKIASVFTQGYGLFAAGLSTQAKARALFLSDWSGASPGSPLITPTAQVRITPRTGTGPGWRVDATVVVDGLQPGLIISSQAGAGTAYLDVEVDGTIGA